MTKQYLAIPLLLAALLSACAGVSPTQRNTAIGAGAGAASGALISKLTGGHHSRRDAAIGAAVGALGAYLWSSHMEQQKQALEEASRGTGVEVSKTPDNQLRLDIPSDISFDVGHAEIRPRFRSILDNFAETMRVNAGTTIRVIGHTDSTGSDAVNTPLSINRAASVRNYLGSRGVEMDRMQIDGRGSREPVADNATAEGRAQNRRVEILIGQQG